MLNLYAILLFSHSHSFCAPILLQAALNSYLPCKAPVRLILISWKNWCRCHAWSLWWKNSKEILWKGKGEPGQGVWTSMVINVPPQPLFKTYWGYTGSCLLVLSVAWLLHPQSGEERDKYFDPPVAPLLLPRHYFSICWHNNKEEVDLKHRTNQIYVSLWSGSKTRQNRVNNRVEHIFTCEWRRLLITPRSN